MVETKKKLVALATAGALVAAMGLTACGNSGTSSSNASNSNASVNASNTANSSSSNAASNASNSSATTPKAAEIVCWRGTLSDGAAVTYIESNDGKQAAIAIEPEKSEPKTWAGELKVAADGKATIVDDDTKNEIHFVLDGITKDAVAVIDFSQDGYGQGALVPLTAEEAVELAATELIAEALGTYTNSLGMLDDGRVIFYTESQDKTEGVVAIVSKDGKDTKVYSGKLTTDANGKETVTDEKTKETFSYTWTENKDDGTIAIVSDEYGKGTLVKMTVGDWIALDEIEKELTKLAK